MTDQIANQTMAILVDPNARTVTEVPYSGDLAQFREYTGSDSKASAPFMNAGAGGYFDEDDYWVEGESPIPGLSFTDSLLMDDDAMFCDDCAFFKTPFHCYPVAGKALIVGTSDEGRNASPEITVEQVRQHITFMGYNIGPRS